MGLAICMALLSTAGCSANSAPESTGSAPAATTPSGPSALKKIEPAALQTAVDVTTKELLIPGAVVVLRTPQGDFTSASGTTLRGAESPPSADTYFRIASNTKTMTAAVIVLLAQEGKLRFTDPVSRYVPGVPNGENITIAELLTMRSGLYNYTSAPELAATLDADPTKAWTPQEVLSIAFRRPPDFPPGTDYAYCNTNYALLGLVAEKTDGKSLARIFQDRLFGPQRLHQTMLPASASTSIPAPYSHGYMYGGSAFALSEEGQFERLSDPSAWQEYRSTTPAVVGAAAWLTGGGADEEMRLLRPASPGAQPFVLYRFVTTVSMKGRAIQRRITERVVQARADGVEYYMARTYSGRGAPSRGYVPVRALWGCIAEPVPPRRASDPLVTRLRFPRALQKGEFASFASEAWFSHEESEAEDRDWIDVDIDHCGILRGRLAYNGVFPSRGLTIRVIFDEPAIPVAAWWYAEATEHERLACPPDGDKRLLPIHQGAISYTFTETLCQPRESYGISLQW